MHAPPKHSLRRRSGFTLVELLVASAITVVLAGAMVAILAQVSATWARAGGGLVAMQQAEQALDLLARDLETAVMRRDGRVWLIATVQPDQSGAGDIGGSLARWSPPVRKPGEAAAGTPASSLQLAPASGRLEDCRFGMAGVWLRFIAQVPDRNDAAANTSGPRAVAYQIVRHAVTGDAGSAQVYSLFRSEVRPYSDDSPARERSTFAVGCDLCAEGYNTTSGGGNLGDAGTVRRPRRELVLGNHVVDFGVRFLGPAAGSGRLELLFPTGNDNRAFVATTSPGAVPVHPPVPAGQTSRGFPTAAELFIRVLTEEGARQIAALEQGQVAGPAWWEIARAHSVVCTRRVVLEASP
jgi:prepilin-type N-terminal cleavage/methylation domain-containing protein